MIWTNIFISSIFKCFLLILVYSTNLVCLTNGIRITSTKDGTDDRNDKSRTDGSTSTSNIRREMKDVNVVIPDSPDGHLVHELPLLDPQEFTTRHWSGHLPASDDGTKYFFYWLFEPDIMMNHNPSDDLPQYVQDKVKNLDSVPLVVWLNGGPGCSSMDGLFLENGPFRFVPNNVTGEFEIKAADMSWHHAPAYTLYIDQPVGTGLSFTTTGRYPTNDQELGKDFYFFLQSFLQFHADKFLSADMVRTRKPLYFSGESYAGHYIPVFVDYIIKENEKKEPNAGHVHIDVSGVAIGNGWIHPYYQYAGAEAAYGMGLLGTSEVEAFAKKEIECQNTLNSGRYNSRKCFDLIDEIVNQSLGSGSNFYKVNPYDVRKVETRKGGRDFPHGHKVIETYLGGVTLKDETKGTMSSWIKNVVLEAIHATAAIDAGQQYLECTDPPYDALAHQDGKGVVDELVSILNGTTKVLLFNGIHDLICNHVGNERLLDNLPWKNKEEWIKKNRYAWMSEMDNSNMASGYIREYKNLMYLKVMNSGHMVPMDVPEIALDMIRTLIYDGSFESFRQGLDRAVPGEDSQEQQCPACPETKLCSEVIQELVTGNKDNDDET